MSLYVITYDERVKTHNYQPLYDELKRIGAKHLQNSVWVLENAADPSAVFDTLWAKMHDNDTLAVIKLLSPTDWKVADVRKEGLDWLQAH